ncbi:MAG: aminoglycoside phosphotransferase family protein [Patescibacteria group bacterium]
MLKTIKYKKTGFDEINEIDFAINLRNFLLLGCSKVTIKRIYHGSVNRNFKIITNKETYFCKVGPLWYEGSLHRESWALKTIRQIGCNVPNIIMYLNKTNKVLPGHEVLLLEYVDGELLANKDNMKNYYSKIIALYNSIHSISMEKYGWLDERFIGKNKNWLDFLLQIENEKTINQLGSVWKDNLSFVRNKIKNCNYGDVSGKLLYGDFNYYNFIVNKEDNVVAFDFQNCFSGDPLYDVGIIFAKDSNFEKYLHYFNTFDFVYKEDKRKLIFLYSLRCLFSMISFYATTKNQERISFAKNRFIEIRRLYDKYY